HASSHGLCRGSGLESLRRRTLRSQISARLGVVGRRGDGGARLEQVPGHRAHRHGPARSRAVGGARGRASLGLDPGSSRLVSMPELRKDPVVDRWVILAPERAARPSEYAEVEPPRIPRPCPFCPGRESETPHETLTYRQDTAGPDTPGWSLRVF